MIDDFESKECNANRIFFSCEADSAANILLLKNLPICLHSKKVLLPNLFYLR